MTFFILQVPASGSALLPESLQNQIVSEVCRPRTLNLNEVAMLLDLRADLFPRASSLTARGGVAAPAEERDSRSDVLEGTRSHERAHVGPYICWQARFQLFDIKGEQGRVRQRDQVSRPAPRHGERQFPDDLIFFMNEVRSRRTALPTRQNDPDLTTENDKHCLAAVADAA